MTKIYGWVARGLMLLAVGVGLINVDEPTVAFQTERECISVVGESVSYGSLVFEVPAFGFFVVRTPPLSLVLQETLDEQGIDLEVRDRTVRASYLAPEGETLYMESPEYELLLQDGCKYVVIGVWMNDLTMREPGEGAEEHIELLTKLMGDIRFFRADSEILLVAYYHGQPAAFVPEYRDNIIDINVPLFNEAIFAACEPEGRFAKIGLVTCLDIDPIFAEMDNTHVVTATGRAAFYEMVYEPLVPPMSDSFRIFWEQNPNAVANGDGMHLTMAGKKALVGLIVETLLKSSLTPNSG